MRTPLFLSILSGLAVALPAQDSLTEKRGPGAGPDPSLATEVSFHGTTFINKGLVAFGLIPANAKDSTGDTLGGIGSAARLKLGTFKAKKDGTFTGTLVTQPDRGFNVDKTIDWQTRQHEVDFVLNPYYSAAPLSFTDAQKTLSLTYKSTLLYTWEGLPTSGLDPLAIKTVKKVDFPVPAVDYPHLSTDPEGLALNKDGTFWISDEYGPYVYLLSNKGEVLQTIVPPDAIIPKQNGTTNFTAGVTPQTGRSPNQGFEGLTTSPCGESLYVLLQSATVQDGGPNKAKNRYTRFLKYNVKNLNNIKLEAEYIVPLPQSSKGNTLAQSELLWLNDNQFLVLARDGNGAGDTDTGSKYKAADLIDTSGATNIAKTKFDSPSNPAATNGVLDSSITPTAYQTFVQYINSTQLARFGLKNGGVLDQTLIAAKWESLALAPAYDDQAKDDYFLFTLADNDFLTTDGVAIGQPYNAGMNVDNQAFVWRVTLPTVDKGEIKKSIGI